jgi:dGTPase
MTRSPRNPDKPASPRAWAGRKTREHLEHDERSLFAPYAQFSAETRGRTYEEPRHPYRTDYQRDRARIIHSRSFRRLEFKTQVFLSGSGDHLRNRLTHTIEVASVSRTIARALGLNEDLAEAIALAHDLGHSPFGHSGEETLNRLMKDHGGFEHNLQSLRMVDLLEEKYPRFPGLNLSYEVTEGLKKHHRFYEAPGAAAGERYTCPSLEAQIANLADEITYYSHDLDDGLDFELLDFTALRRLEIWTETEQEARALFPELKGKLLRRYLIRCLIDREVEDVIATSSEAIRASGVQSADDVRNQPAPLIRYSDRLRKHNQSLRSFLYKNLYYHPKVAGANRKACQLLEEVFHACLEKPSLMGRSFSRRIKESGLHRCVCDYIASMTDRYLMKEHERIFGARNA